MFRILLNWKVNPCQQIVKWMLGNSYFYGHACDILDVVDNFIDISRKFWLTPHSFLRKRAKLVYGDLQWDEESIKKSFFCLFKKSCRKLLSIFCYFFLQWSPRMLPSFSSPPPPPPRKCPSEGILLIVLSLATKKWSLSMLLLVKSYS